MTIRQRQIVQKNILIPHLETPIDTVTKSGETHVHDAKCHADRPEIFVPGQKLHIFPYTGFSWGLPSHAIYF